MRMPAREIQDHWIFGEFGGVNPSITDSSTFTFLNPETMAALFEQEMEGCFLYARHCSPSGTALAESLARMEGTEAALVTGSGMAAISATLLQLCSQGDEILSSRTIYGGTYALMKHVLPRFGITTRFVDILDLNAVTAAIQPRTKLIYCEAISNPLLEVTDLPALGDLAHDHGLPLVVDNTFSPLVIAPTEHGADIVIHSLTKFINGASDGVGGAVCAAKDFIAGMMDVNSGMAMLLGPVLDSMRAASIRKNLQTLPVRMQRHSRNALYLAEQLSWLGQKVHYPGLTDHPQHELMDELMHPDFGYGGMLVLDMIEQCKANDLMVRMQAAQVGYLAVSLGYYRTLFSCPGTSTSSEISEEEQDAMGLSKGMVRMSVGLDEDIEETFRKIRGCLEAMGVIRTGTAVTA